MSFDLVRMRALAVEGPVTRVVIIDAKGSVPRGVGTDMIVTKSELFGTIGGGALEYEAIRMARETLSLGRDRVDRRPLGPSLGQCCGGAVTLLTEVWDSERLNTVEQVVARPLPGEISAMPESVSSVLNKAAAMGSSPQPVLISGWFVEPVSCSTRSIWVWGAGHVGRALVGVLAPLPGFSVTWADTGPERFPGHVSPGIVTVFAENPGDLVGIAPDRTEHFVMTYSHAMDLDICHRVLSRSFRYLGLIGSETKRARFRKRLLALGHSEKTVRRMTCPIGDPALGKHPQAIAVGVVADLLREHDAEAALGETG